MFQLQLSLPFTKYGELVIPFEKFLDQIKFEFNELGIKIPHPSLSENLSGKQIEIISKTYSNHIKYFGDTNKFYAALLLLNYHKGNIILLAKKYNYNELNQMSFTISMEDFLVLSTFENLT